MCRHKFIGGGGAFPILIALIIYILMKQGYVYDTYTGDITL